MDGFSPIYPFNLESWSVTPDHFYAEPMLWRNPKEKLESVLTKLRWSRSTTILRAFTGKAGSSKTYELKSKGGLGASRQVVCVKGCGEGVPSYSTPCSALQGTVYLKNKSRFYYSFTQPAVHNLQLKHRVVTACYKIFKPWKTFKEESTVAP